MTSPSWRISFGKKMADPPARMSNSGFRPSSHCSPPSNQQRQPHPGLRGVLHRRGASHPLINLPASGRKEPLPGHSKAGLSLCPSPRRIEMMPRSAVGHSWVAGRVPKYRDPPHGGSKTLIPLPIPGGGHALSPRLRRTGRSAGPAFAGPPMTDALAGCAGGVSPWKTGDL